MSVLPTKEDCAYAAGVMDSDGSISINRNRRANRRIQFIVTCKVSQTNNASIKFLQSRWGGTSYCYDQKVNPNIPNRKPIHTWRLNSRQTDQFLHDIYPYLVMKKEQARLCKIARAFMSGACVSKQRSPITVKLYPELQFRVSSLNVSRLRP